MAVNKRLLQGAAAAGGITPSEHFGVVLYEGDNAAGHSINGGKFGAGAYFAGSGNITPSGLTSDQLGPNGEMSISWWMNTPINDTTVAFICEGDTDSEYMVHLGGSNTRGMRIAFAAATTNVLDVNNAFTANTWQHFVAIMTPTGNKLYRDGSLVGSNTFSETRTDFSTFYIGSRRNSSLRFEGKLDQLRIFAKELSSTEVSTLYAETAATVESLDPLSEDTTDTLQVLGDTSCVALYKLENNEDDKSGNYDGTGTSIQYATGRYGQGAIFSDSDSKINIPDNFGAEGETASYSLWFKTTDADGSYMFAKRTGNNTFHIRIDNGYAFSPAGKICVNNWQSTNNANANAVSTNGGYNDGGWHHFVFTYDGNASTRTVCYIDGVLDSGMTLDYNLDTQSVTNGNNIGNYDLNSSNFSGTIDQVRIFNKTLSASEVTTLYQENSLVASYRFEGNSNDDMRTFDGTDTNVTYEYGLNFTPDFVWIKSRTNTLFNNLFNSTVGANYVQYSNSNSAGETNANIVASFDTGGFTVGTDNSANQSGQDFVAWCLKANGGTTSSNTDGNVNTTVQVNEAAGFSIIKTANSDFNESRTFGHGLGNVGNGIPDFFIIKPLSKTFEWRVYTSADSYAGFTKLNSSDAKTNVTTNVTSSTFNTQWTPTGASYESEWIMYAFKSIDGFSKFGSYTGNGSANGPIVETGFEPAFLMVKRTDSGSSVWTIYDNKRNTTNPRDKLLHPNLSNAEATASSYQFNFFSNGFQPNGTSTDINASGGTYIYMAFAADPDTEAPTLASSFNIETYTGNSSTQSIEGLGFSPNLVWIKGRNNTYVHGLYDTIRGSLQRLRSNGTEANENVPNSLTSFDSDGFTLGSDIGQNQSANNYVAWAWKADDNEATIEEVTEDLNAVAVYKFEDNGDDVTGSYDATSLENITYSSSGKFNKAIEFNGSNSAFRTTGTLGLTGNMDFGVSFWMNADSLSGDQFLWGSGVGGGNFAQVGLMIRNNTTIYADNRGNTDPMTSSQSLSTGTWYHIVHTYSASAQTHYLYINGSYIGSVGTVPINITTNNGSTIGIRPVDDTYRFDGRIDQFRVYHATLTSSNVTTLYNETAAQNDNLSLGMTYVASSQSIVSANANAGFSIVKYTGTYPTHQKIPHGLSAAPNMIIIKNLADSADWEVYHSATGNTGNLVLNSTAAFATNSGFMADTSPTATLFTVGNDGYVNGAGDGHIAYCFHDVSGYQKFGSYTGNGSSTGPTVTTGFKPDFVMYKGSTQSGNWGILDSARDSNNPRNEWVAANLSNAESTETTRQADFLSTGFQPKGTNTDINTNGETYIYWAVAKNVPSNTTLANSFKAVTYTGNGSSQSITGTGFTPDLVWIKQRSGTQVPIWYDSNRGAGNYIFSSGNDAQGYANSTVKTFDSDGFSVGSSNSENQNSQTFVAWTWKAGNTWQSNLDGTIGSTVNANTANGFSIAKWTGTGSAGTVGHSLSSTPEMIITKRLSGTSDWYTYHKDLNSGTNPAYNFIKLNSSDAEIVNASSGGSIWNSTSPSSTVINVGTTLSGSTSDSYVAYCFHSVSGYSKIGSYNGNGSTQSITGLGFQPDWIMIKNVDSARGWQMFDSVRGVNKLIFANDSSAESSESAGTSLSSFDSDGFTVGSGNGVNESGDTLIYMAFKMN